MHKILLTNIEKNTVECIPSEELPREVTHISPIHCTYSMREVEDYFLIEYTAMADVTFICQRCGDTGNTRISLTNTVALCPNDDVAERLLKHHESVVYQGAYVDLEKILMDELRLHSYLKHSDKDCQLDNNADN